MSWREYGALDKQGSEADSDSDAGRGQLKFCEIPIPMLIYPVKKKSDADSGADDGWNIFDSDSAMPIPTKRPSASHP